MGRPRRLIGTWAELQLTKSGLLYLTRCLKVGGIVQVNTSGFNAWNSEPMSRFEEQTKEKKKKEIGD